MAQSNPIQTLFYLIDEKRIEEDEEYKKLADKTGKLFEQLEKYLNADKGLNDAFTKYRLQNGQRAYKEKELCYREGFLCGARLMLEICGK